MFDFAINKGKDTGFSLDLGGGAEFKSYLSYKESKKLFVLFNGAIDLEKKYPYYQRWGWKEKFPGNVLYILDPLIKKYEKDKLNLAWYLGDRDLEYSSLISEFVNYVANQLAVDEIYSYGSSGGGFASLMLAKKLPKVYAIAINPQTNIFDYHKNDVEKYLRLAWQCDIQDAKKSIKNIDFDVFDYSGKKCLIVQNTVDIFHFKNHLIKFLKENSIESDKKELIKSQGISYILYDHPNGHGAEPSEIFQKIIDTAIANY